MAINDDGWKNVQGVYDGSGVGLTPFECKILDTLLGKSRPEPVYSAGVLPPNAKDRSPLGLPSFSSTDIQALRGEDGWAFLSRKLSNP